MNNSVSNTARLLGAGLRALLVLTVVTGVLYPLAVTGVAQALFHDEANGSRVEADGRVVGSSLIGQSYNLPLKPGQETPEPDLKWFQGRPANGLGENTLNTQYRLILSGATNLAADNPELVEQVRAAQAAVIEDNSVPGHTVERSDIPADAVTSSGSGLDPDISPSYAELQVPRVARNNGLPVDRVEELVDEHTEGRTLGFVGEPRVNVLELNIALKGLTAKS
ncbi:potassium-transporting ATPase subunit C [Streptomyces sp. Alain-F2R5]|jgi:potassium-transporting ATPase KdpC subunit|uniref:potassium-transporting ATPase subunit C n=1 Tax=Streptomyces TaxID=1883 RepID=UPI000A251650|nr:MULTISPECIES: potassium-transporting ATPase subunit C [unclassified Streptomyces]OSC61944.1 potassium-transporting ATPase subunit C [Streptomyces sp. 4F]MDN3248120.1 potassium-transporting ATPase subunit C [Streptomyces sp. ZSW22]MDN3253377.1 potassium-transporting ATPase subunit C [Streptomyces sp. MA25(2023)]MDQ0389011.1 K+-transporting ATPase ATPase C chain [Streptomyces sp. DSM 42143]PAK25927.1 potassium-transporting ATPase subunit C [Streptomyces sp. alain-838]